MNEINTIKRELIWKYKIVILAIEKTEGKHICNISVAWATDCIQI